jgi:hypothetical protein
MGAVSAAIRLSSGECRMNQTDSKTELRPFHVRVPDAELNELRKLILATRSPERETVADTSQGVQLATVEALARYWTTDNHSSSNE